MIPIILSLVVVITLILLRIRERKRQQQNRNLLETVTELNRGTYSERSLV